MAVAIITGITGQDGSLLAQLLSAKGYTVVGLTSDRPLDLFRLDYLKVTEKISLKKVDLLSITEVRSLLEEYKPDEFYNLAAISSVGFSFREPLNTFEFNTRSVHNILEAIRETSSKTRFYQASSSEMFGNVGHHSLPIKESFLFHPVSPYGISKASAHWLTVNYREAYKLQTCCGILFNHESALRPGHFVIKKIINTAIQIKNGTAGELQLGNIAIVRDWGYAPAYVEAMWRMMQHDRLDDYLICSGFPISLQKFVQKVFNTLNLNASDYLRLDTNLLRSLDLEIIYGDNSKAKHELQWSYGYGPDELIAQLIKDEYDFIKWSDSKNAAS